VHFDAPAWRATAALAVGWGCILPVLATRAQRWTREAA